MDRLTRNLFKDTGKPVTILCYCLECRERFALRDYVGSYGVPIVCVKGHDGPDQVDVLTPFIERLLNETT